MKRVYNAINRAAYEVFEQIAQERGGWNKNQISLVAVFEETPNEHGGRFQGDVVFLSDHRQINDNFFAENPRLNSKAFKTFVLNHANRSAF